MSINLNTKSLFLTIIGLLFFLSTFSQKISQNDSLLLNQRISTSKEIKLDTFLIIWVHNYTNERNIWKVREFHRDSTFTYFIDNKLTFHILNKELSKIDYKSIDGLMLKEKLYDDILPMKDKIDIEVIQCEIGGSKGMDCFKCSFVESEMTLNLEFRYYVKCDFFYKFKKTYTARYNVSTKELINTTKKVDNKNLKK